MICPNDDISHPCIIIPITEEQYDEKPKALLLKYRELEPVTTMLGLHQYLVWNGVSYVLSQEACEVAFSVVDKEALESAFKKAMELL